MRAKHIILTALVLALVVAVASAAACGGSGGGTETTGIGTETTTVGTETTVSGSGEAAALFTANCAVCHGGSGQGRSGPDLRPLTTEDLSRIEHQIRNGGIAMPAFGSTFSDQQVTDLAEYVADLGF